MTKKILNIEGTIKISKKLKAEGKTLVLAGGCFDIIHIGHVKFLQKAKEQGDYLIVLLESDEKVKKIKGNQRPINNQTDRALILEALCSVDAICLLPPMLNDADYKHIVIQIKPDIIATTKNDSYIGVKVKQAELIKAKVVTVIDRIEDKSTSNIAKLIHERF